MRVGGCVRHRDLDKVRTTASDAGASSNQIIAEQAFVMAPSSCSRIDGHTVKFLAAGGGGTPYSGDIATALVSRTRKPGWRRSTPGPGLASAVALLRRNDKLYVARSRRCLGFCIGREWIWIRSGFLLRGWVRFTGR